MKYKKVSKLTRKGYEFVEEWTGAKFWYLNGSSHREDGPSMINSDGTRKTWSLHGVPISLETKSKNPKVKKHQEYMKLEEILEK
jgi:hypothetical protein